MSRYRPKVHTSLGIKNKIEKINSKRIKGPTPMGAAKGTSEGAIFEQTRSKKFFVGKKKRSRVTAGFDVGSRMKKHFDKKEDQTKNKKTIQISRIK